MELHNDAWTLLPFCHAFPEHLKIYSIPNTLLAGHHVFMYEQWAFNKRKVRFVRKILFFKILSYGAFPMKNYFCNIKDQYLQFFTVGRNLENMDSLLLFHLLFCETGFSTYFFSYSHFRFNWLIDLVQLSTFL